MSLARSSLALVLSCALPLAAGLVSAQTGAAASAPAAATPASGPRLPTPAESRERAQPVDEAQPAGKAMPQISLPLGKAPPAPLLPSRRRNAASAARGIDDAAARCEAEADAQQRAACRDRLARTEPKR